MRDTFLPFHRASIDDAEIDAVTAVLRSGWITTGPKVKEFEKDLAAYVGAKHAVAVNSCTAAMHLALAAIGLKPGDEVLLPTNTFTATAEVVTYFGAKPVMADCRRDTFNIDERALEERVTANTRAVIPVHIAGQPCDMGSIMDIADRYSLKVIEDAAHALPTKDGGRMVGSIGDITAFSFYATKTITTAEGGMATTDNPEYADRMRMMSLHGISHDPWNRYSAEGSWYYEVVNAGFKYNMTDVAAAMGVHQLKKSDAFRERRSHIAGLYTEAFSKMAEVRPPVVRAGVQHAWHLYILLLDPETLAIGRSRFIEELKNRNIGASVHFIPLHLHPYYRDTFGYQRGEFPNAEWVYDRCVSLPIFPGMTDQDVSDVVEAVGDIARQYRR